MGDYNLVLWCCHSFILKSYIAKLILQFKGNSYFRLLPLVDQEITAIYRVASIASFISFHREYNQSEARNPLHTSAGCNGQYFKKISRRRLRPPHFPLKKEKGGLSARQNFSFYQNFQMQVCKQYYKNRVNIHSNFLEVSDVKKVIRNEIK